MRPVNPLLATRLLVASAVVMVALMLWAGRHAPSGGRFKDSDWRNVHRAFVASAHAGTTSGR